MNTALDQHHDHIAAVVLATLVGLAALGGLLNAAVAATGHPVLASVTLAAPAVTVVAGRWVACGVGNAGRTPPTPSPPRRGAPSTCPTPLPCSTAAASAPAPAAVAISPASGRGWRDVGRHRMGDRYLAARHSHPRRRRRRLLARARRTLRRLLGRLRGRRPR